MFGGMSGRGSAKRSEPAKSSLRPRAGKCRRPAQHTSPLGQHPWHHSRKEADEASTGRVGGRTCMSLGLPSCGGTGRILPAPQVSPTSSTTRHHLVRTCISFRRQLATASNSIVAGRPLKRELKQATKASPAHNSINTHTAGRHTNIVINHAVRKLSKLKGL